MKKGSRSVIRLCACNCGDFVSPYIGSSGRVERYPKYIPGHGRRLYAARLSEKYRNDPSTHPSFLPVGTRRKHDTGGRLFYWVVKISPTKWEYEHRVVLAEKIGRDLLPGEDVHHINELTLDNRPENLELKSHSDHSRYHAKLAPGRWSRWHDNCISCQLTDSVHASSGRCARCYQRIQRESRILL